MTRKSAGRIREDHVKLRVGGVQRVAAAHAHSADLKVFHRRTYHLMATDASEDIEQEPFWYSLVHYRACEPREDGSRKIRRDRGVVLRQVKEEVERAQEEVERRIAEEAELLHDHGGDEDDDCCCEISDEILARTVKELFNDDSSTSSPSLGCGARIVDGAVDAFTGLAVPRVQLDRIPPPPPPPLQENEHVCDNPVSSEHGRGRDEEAPIVVRGFALHVVDAAPLHFDASGEDGSILLALDGHLLFDPLTRQPNPALGFRQGDRLGVQFAFGPETHPSLCVIEAFPVNACALRSRVPHRNENSVAAIKVVALGADSTVRPLSPESACRITWGTPANTTRSLEKQDVGSSPITGVKKKHALKPISFFPPATTADEDVSPSSFACGHSKSRQLTAFSQHYPTTGKTRASDKSDEDEDTVKDDDALASLAEAELDEAVERLVLRVVAQMSKIARVNSDLADELDVPDSHGFGLLHYCALYNLGSVISEILALGANPDGRSAKTPLHLAASAGHAGVVSALLAGGADASRLDEAGRTPLDFAIDHGHFKVASLLEDYHAEELRISPRTRHTPGVVLPVTSVKRIRRQKTLDECDEELFGDVDEVEDMRETDEAGEWLLKQPTKQHQRQKAKDLARGEEESDEGITRALLDTAFSTLSLHEKCALSIASPKEEQHQEARANAATSVISTENKDSLNVAMSLMGASELREVKREASVITANVRSWIVRRNYIKVREAARTLESRWLLRKKASDLSSICSAENMTPRNTLDSLEDPCNKGEEGSNNSDAHRHTSSKKHFVKLQAASRGMLERRKLRHVKEQMVALLVISRNFKGKKFVQRQKPAAV